ncbi:MAG: GEVED domain-containing protein [Bacteroidia bacterium]
MTNMYKKISLALLVAAGIFVTKANAQVNVVATAGTATASYATVNAAFAAINAGTHQGDITIGVAASTTEPATPTPLLASGQSAAVYTSVLIKPTAVVTIAGATVTGRGVLEFNGADNITIDGDTVGGAIERNLTIQNTAANTIAATAVVRLIGNTTGGLGTNNIMVKNCIIIGSTTGNNGASGSTVTSTFGIYGGGTGATLTAAGAGNNYDNVTIQNNEIKQAYIGVYVVGGTTTQCDNLNINNNTIGDANLAQTIGFKGIALQQIDTAYIRNNTISNIKVNTAVNIAAIEVGGSASLFVNIAQNKIYAIANTNTGGQGAYGINITNGLNTMITNNVIYDITTLNYSLVSTTFHAFGIRLSGGMSHKIYYNSINMYGAYTLGSSTTTANSAAIVVTATNTVGNITEIKNNIFANKISSAAAASAEMVAMWFGTGYNFALTNINNNGYFVSPDAKHFIAKVGTTAGAGNYATLAAWKAISSVGNANNDNASTPDAPNANAPFTADNDLTIPASTQTGIESGAVAIPGLTIDYTNATRPVASMLGNNGGTAPDMGAYEFDGKKLPLCAGAPSVGVITKPSNVCSGTAFGISATNPSTDLGITFQWYSSADSATFAPIAGATALNYNVAAGITDTMWYKIVYTCSYSGLKDSVTSTAVALNSFLNCYCAATYTSGCGGTGSDAILNVKFNIINNTTACAAGPAYYSSFNTPVPSMTTGTTDTVKVSFGSDGSQFAGVWIDLNQDGDFGDVGEFVANNTVSAGANGISNLIFTLPFTATPGTTKMRIRGGNDSQLGNTPCGVSSSTWGETEDYLINIVAAPQCTTTPVLGTVNAPMNVCSGSPFAIGVSTPNTDYGVNVQWKKSTDGVVFTDIAGATTQSYNVAAGITDTTWYRIVYSCQFGGTMDSLTTAMPVNLKPFYECYTCGTVLHSATTNAIDSVYITSTTLAHAAVGINSNTTLGYSKFAPMGNATGDIDLGSTYTMGAKLASTSSVVSAWIDYNKNGLFEASEWIDVTRSSVAGNNEKSFTTPAFVTSTDTGRTGMRIRTRTTGNTGPDACTNFFSGETQDYVVRLVELPCLNPTSPGTLTLADSAYTNTAPTYAVIIGQTGDVITWQKATALAGPYTPVAGATNNDSLLINLGLGKWYIRAVMTSIGCPNDTSSIDSTIVAFKCINPTTAGTVSVADTSYSNATPTNNVVITGQTGETITWQYATTIGGTYSTLTGSINNDSAAILLAPGKYYIQALITSLGCTSSTSNIDSTIVILKGDNVCDAIPLTFGTSPVYTNAGSTLQVGEATSVAGWLTAANNTVWFSFTAPASGLVRAQSPGFDTQLAIWAADACDSLLSSTGRTLIKGSDDDAAYVAHGGAQYSSYIDSVKCLTPGKTYYISLDGYGTTTTGSTSIILTNIAVDTVFTGVTPVVCSYSTPITLTAPAGGVFTSAQVMGTTYTPSAMTTTDTIKVTVLGCYSSTQLISVSKPVVTVMGDTAVCAGLSTTLMGMGVASYAWTAGPATAMYVVTPTAPTTYEVIGTDASGCVDTTTFKVNVNALPAAPIIMATSPELNCTITTDTLSASNYTMGLTWSNGDTTAKSVVNVAGTYYATYTDANGCKSDSSNNLTIISNTGIALAFTAPSPNDSICVGGTANLAVTGTAVNYTWSPALTLSASTGTNVIATPTATTTYTVVADNGAGCSVKDSVTITIVPNAIVTATAASPVVTVTSGNISNAVTVTGATTFDFTSSVTGVATHTMVAGTALTTSINDSIGASTGGNGTVDYVITGYNAIGCPSAPVMVTVNISSVVALANKAIDANLNIYPNPTANVLNVSVKANTLNVTMFDATGKVVKQANVNGNTTQLTVSDLASGTYSLRITTEAGTTVKKVTVTKE